MLHSIKTFYSPHQEARDAPRFLHRNTGIVQIEGRQRAKALHEYVSKQPEFSLAEPMDFGLRPILNVHSKAYVKFLQESAVILRDVHDPVVADTFPSPSAQWIPPDTFSSRLGRYSMHSGTALDAGTWASSYWSAQAAISAVSFRLRSGDSAFAMCRPAGHHASHSGFGGLCFLNNVAIATNWALMQGIKKIGILDIDVHHGNGTQEIFYESDRVFTSSIHINPSEVFPIHSGFLDEKGRGNGFGENSNRPLNVGAHFGEWRCAVEEALDEFCSKKPDLSLISLGFDFLESDPVSHFRIPLVSSACIGGILKTKLPNSVFFLEGGYNLSDMCTAMSLFFKEYMST